MMMKMGSRHVLLLVALCASLMLIGEGCRRPRPPGTNCCSSRSGSTSAPRSSPDSQSPAGGPASNPDAAVCMFYRSSNCLVCRRKELVSKCCTKSPDETDDREFGGPIPYKEYLIGEQYIHSGHGIDWYNLYPREDVRGYYNYTQPTGTGRHAMGLHEGSTSLGGMTVKENSCWLETSDILNGGHMTYLGSGYSGFLYVC